MNLLYRTAKHCLEKKRDRLVFNKEEAETFFKGRGGNRQGKELSAKTYSIQRTDDKFKKLTEKKNEAE